ncbi:hypothetical protein ACE193_21245 [Bernardetia sp. OM2101]|uniref:hypothetical protein n=1 Tax=Bernardetia sp. OM2101 TaxID=3344876 RepID=UPI0035CFFFBF
MTENAKKREKIFNVFSSQLNTLNSGNLLPSKYKNLKFDKTYVCPICLVQFSRDDLNTEIENFLTLEDAPQKSLGGKANTLTCKKCNNTCGAEIDFHLVEGVHKQDRKHFLPNTTGRVKFSISKGEQVQGEYSVNDAGVITVEHSTKNNNPAKLSYHIDNIRKDSIVILEHKASKVDEKKLEVALLKTAYILAFEKFGYSIILDECFDIVREQLLKPNNEIYPEGFWTRQEVFTEKHEGLHLIKINEGVGLFCVFPLKTQSSTKRFGVYLPLPKEDTEKTIKTLKNMQKDSPLTLYPLSSDFIHNFQKTEEIIKDIKAQNKK